MCGICGFISKDPVKIPDLKKMNDKMIHRGPDDSGEEIFDIEDGYAAGMAHRRLSILDLSEKGHQPLTSPDKRVTIVYNGEIYNFRELKKELSGYPFVSQCDTEVILASYLTWGIDCVEKLDGMFAIAIFDREDNKLYLARDRAGKKPLYYWHDKSRFVFASELKPVMEYPYFRKEINRDILPDYLFHQYIAAPDTIFQNVKKLEQGTYLLYHYASHKIEKHRYWDLKEQYHRNSKNQIKDYNEAKDGLKQVLERAVEKRMISDVPLGTFLSGGYDSSLVTAIAAKFSAAPIKTYTIGFQEKDYNEAEYAKEISKYLGTNHTELYVTKNDMRAMIDEIAVYYDEPFADSSQIPTMLVSKLASGKVKVVLTGDGGDEFFCGYNVYELLPAAQKLDLLGEMVYRLCHSKIMRSSGLWEKLPYPVRTIAGNRNRDCKTQFGGESYVSVANRMVLNDKKSPCKYAWEREIGESDWQIRRMLLDMLTYLPDDILCKVDRGGMRYSLEARCPLLDQNVMEFSFRIPQKYKYRKSEKKKILKDLTCSYIPKELLDRPKHGFSIPLDQWLRGELKEEVLELSSRENLQKQGIFDEAFVLPFIEKYMRQGDQGNKTGGNYSKMIWSYYIFQKWYQRYF